MKQDVIVKNYWRDRDRFADLFNAALFHGESVISAEHLTEGPTEMIGKTDSTTEGFLSKYRDMMMSYSYEGIALAILGLENQDQIHYAMPLRALIYDCMNYQEQYHSLQKKHRQKRDLSKKEFLSGISKEERLTPVITLVVYYGEESWDGARTLHDMLEIPSGWKPFVNDYPMHLIEVRNQNLIFHHRDNQNLFALFQILYEHSQLSSERKQAAIEYTRKHPVDPEVLSVIASSSQFPDVAKQQLNTKGEHTMCQVFDEIFNEGKKEGHTAGLVAGKEEGSITQMIRIYLKFGTPTQTILEEMEKELHLSHKQALLLYDKYRPKVSI